MGLMGSAFGNALAGAGAAAEDIANKYIDQNLALQRAQVLADIQRNSAVQQTKDIDAYTNDPKRRAAMRDEAAADETSIGTARNDVALKGKIAEASSTDLTQAQVDRENAIVKGTTQAKVDADNAITTGTMRQKAQAAGLMAAAQRGPDLGADERAARTDLLKMEVADKKRLGDLYDKYTAINNDPNMDDASKQAALKPIVNSIQAIKAKSAGPAQRDPELDTQTVVDEKLNPDGTTTKTTRKEVRRPGGGSSDQAPYPDGTELKGKDGKTYVVQGGKPVEKVAKSLMDQSTKTPPAAAPARPMDQNEAVLAEAAKRREEMLARQAAESRAQAGRAVVGQINGANPIDLQPGD